jgi:ABC-2 type transport system permease protein
MQTNIPSASTVFASLLRADFITQWRSRRAFIMVILVPVIILIFWKGLIPKFGGGFVLSNCITVGLTAIGLMGYSNTVARDRERGIFQRLRVAPVPSWSIMLSRLVVQLAMIIIVTLAVFIVGAYYDKVTLSPAGYALGLASAIVGGAVYLGLGQAIVGRIKNIETVSAVTRLVYFVFIMVGMFGELGWMGDIVSKAVKWSPYGTVKNVVFASMEPGQWTNQTTMYLLVMVGYALLFSFLGIKWFKWNSSK